MDVKLIQQKFEDELKEVLRSIVESYEIAVVTSTGSELAIFVSSSNCSKDKRPKAKKKKNSRLNNNVKLSFSPTNSFDIEKTYNNDGLLDFWLLYQFVKPEVFTPATNRITYWSRALFKAVNTWISNYGVELQMLPFEAHFDENDDLQISKLPNFSDLLFVNPIDSQKTLKASDVIAKQLETISEVGSFVNGLHSVD
ncbi:MAG: hypothetical protein IKD76_05750 [Clostridia bacterium]|nr:hypothetical protein [Clostridia bacterium]